MTPFTMGVIFGNRDFVERRRDAFCGKISVCNNLSQYGFRYSLTDLHTSHPLSDGFKQDLRNFMGVCRVVNGLRNARLGAVGARPNAFNTTRYSEKLLQSVGVSVQTVDLSELLGAANRLKDDDDAVKERLGLIRAYLPSDGVALTRWMQALDIQATALQCWNSIQKNYGINVCTLMSMMSDQLMPSACEVDITGVASMYALQLATDQPAALVDWNNNYAGDPNKCVFFHCANFAKSFFAETRMACADILATTLGDVCLRYFDAEGAPVQTPLNDRVIGMKLEQLRKVKRSVGIAGGERKQAAIQGALRGGYINVLITDLHTAEALVPLQQLTSA